MDDNKNLEGEITEINTNNSTENGENRCPKCGASDITYNIEKKKLICNYCYTEFAPEEIEGIEKEAKNLTEEIRGSGTADIDENSEDIITLKCGGCGAEVVINTKESTNARCHWCRSVLSINSQIKNGAIPDVVLPFGMEKKEAEAKIKTFVAKRQFFAHPIFKKEFTTNNIMGVFFPYILVDANAHGNFKGKGEHLIREYTIEHNDKREKYYDADLYHIEREFDISIDDLSIESSRDKLDKDNKNKTTNIINAIMPFDTENCVKYKANYLAGHSSEKRDINITEIEGKVDKELKDITRYALNNEVKYYDRGVKWEQEDLEIKGKQWVSAYLPVWLYSYQDPSQKLHYVAVNGRTGETMGSIPINKTKLLLVTALIEMICLFLAYLIDSQSKDKTSIFLYILFSIVSIIYYCVKKSKYRNSSARHNYEKETKCEITNLSKIDELEKHLKRLNNSTMQGANNKRIEGENIKIANKENSLNTKKEII